MINLFSINDLKNFLEIDFKIKFIKLKKIYYLISKQKVTLLVFHISDDMLFFENYYDKIIVNFFELKKIVSFLNKSKKYLIVGPWRNQMEYYRFLRLNNFKIYLHKELKNEKK